MSADDDDSLVLRNTAHRMSQGIETKKRKYKLLTFDNVFVGSDAVEWLIADPGSGVTDVDGAIQVGQRLIEHGYIVRVSRELKAKQKRHFSHSERAKTEFRGGDAFYRFDARRTSPFQLHVVVRRARNLKSMDYNGLNDPYVELKLGSQTAVTRVQMKTNDPEWNEHFVFGVNSVESQQLSMSVIDYDKFKLDDHIGSVKIGLSDLPISEPTGPRTHVQSICLGAASDGVSTGEFVPPADLSEMTRESREVSSSMSSSADTDVSSSYMHGQSAGKNVARSDIGDDTMSNHDFDPDDWRSVPDTSRKKVWKWIPRRRAAAKRKAKKRRMRGKIVHPNHARFHMGASPIGPGAMREWRNNSESRPQDLPPIRVERSRGDEGHGAEEGGDETNLTYYQLQTTNEKLAKIAREEGEDDDRQPSVGELGCDIWLTSLQPRSLPVQGETKFSLRCRIWEMCGVTSVEERNLSVISSATTRQRAVLMVYGERVSSPGFERTKDKEKKTCFGGCAISLDFKANMATDMLKFVVQQNALSVETAYKPVATVSIPLRSIPVSDPSKDGSLSDVSDDASAALTPETHAPSPPPSASSTGGGFCAFGLGLSRRDSDAQEAKRAPFSSIHDEPHARRYPLHTLAGPMTSRLMDNGFVVMSLTLVPSGNDLLGEQNPEDLEDLKAPPPQPPPPFAEEVLDVPLECGYQRLRKALLWHDSKLQAAFSDALDYSDVTCTAWVDQDGGAGTQDNLEGCTRQRTFIIPKTALSAAARTESEERVLADGPSLMAYEMRNRTPGVKMGDKFDVAIQLVLIKEGPGKCRLQSSSETVFRDKVMGFVQGQIVSAVSRVTKEQQRQLVDLIEEALSGGSGTDSKSRRRSKKTTPLSVCLWCLGALIILAMVTLLFTRGPLSNSSLEGAGPALPSREDSSYFSVGGSRALEAGDTTRDTLEVDSTYSAREDDSRDDYDEDDPNACDTADHSAEAERQQGDHERDLPLFEMS